MGNIVEFIIKLKNEASNPVAKLTKDVNASAGSVNKLADTTKKFKDVTSATSAPVNNLSSKLSKVNHEVKDLNSNVSKLEAGSSSGLKGYFSELVSQVPSFLVNPIVGITAGLGLAINKGLKNSQTKLEFTNLLGENAGANLYKSLSGMKALFGDETFDFGRKLLTSGVAVDKVTSTMKRLGDVANGSKEGFNSILDAFTEMKVEGKFTEEAYKKLGLLGFNPLKYISKQTGESLDSLRLKMQAGAISVSQVESALEAATSKGGEFYGNMDKINNSPMGKWHEMLTQISSLVSKLGEVLMPTVSTVVNFIVAGFNLVIGAFETTSQWMDSVAFGGLKIKDVLIGLASVIAGAVIAYQAYNNIQQLVWLWQGKDIAITSMSTIAKGIATIATGGLTAATALLNAVMSANPIGIVITLLGALVGAIMWVWNKFEGFGQFFKNLWTIIKASFNLFVVSLKQGFESITYYMELAWLKIKSFGQYIGELFSNIGDSLKLAMEFKFTEAKAKLTATITTEASKEIEQLDKEHKSAQKEYNHQKVNDLMTLLTTPLKGIIKEKQDAKDSNSATNSVFGNTNGITPGVSPNIKTDTKAHEGINAISGGGSKNITVTVGKLIENFTVSVSSQKEVINNIQKEVEEALIRVLASATASAT